MRWYAVVIVMLVAALVVAGHRYRRLLAPDASVPVVTLLGPTEVAPGARARFAVLVRDRAGAPMADAAVRVGLERNGFDELVSAKTGAAGEASVELALARDFVPGEARLLRAYADTPVGRGRDDHWIVPAVPSYGHVLVTTDKPRYVGGETVHVRGVLEREGAIAGERVATIRVERGGLTLFRLEEKVSALGVVAADFPIAEESDDEYAVEVTIPTPAPWDPTSTSTGRAVLHAAPKGRATGDVVPAAPGAIDFTAYPEGGRLVANAKQTLYLDVSGGTARLAALGGSRAEISPSGVGVLALTVPAHDFEVEVADDQGHRKVHTLHPVTDALVVHAEQDAFESGKPAHVTVFGADAGDWIFLKATKGEGVVDLRSAQSTAQGVDFDVPLRDDLEGLVWLEAISTPARTDGTRRIGRRLILARGPSRGLRVKVVADPAEPSTREKGTITVEVTDADGKPVKAELGLCAADEDALDEPRRAKAGPLELERRARDVRDTFGELAGSEIVALAGSEGDEALRGLVLARIGAERTPRTTLNADLEARGAEEHVRERGRMRAWLTIFLGLVALVLLAPFLSSALERVTQGGRPRGALPKEERDRRRRTFLRASAAWDVAVLFPPLAGLAGESAARLMAPSWAIAAIAATIVLTAALRRAGTSLLLVPGLLLAQGACLLSILDRGRALAVVFDVAPNDAYLVPLLLLIAGQIVHALLGVARLAETEPTTLRDRRARFFRSATVAGLPVTAAALGYGFYLHVHAANVDWRVYARGHGASELVARSERHHEDARAAAKHGIGAYVDERRIAWPGEPRERHAILWEPHVLTDEKGRARVPIAYGDASSTYGLSVDAVSRSGEMGAARTSITVGQGFAVTAAIPPVLAQGEELALPVTVQAAKDAGEDVVLTATGFEPLTRRLKLAAGSRDTAVLPLRAARAGTYRLRIEAAGTSHREALERDVIVRPKESAFQVRNGLDTTVTFPSDADALDLHVKVYGSPLALVAEAIDAQPPSSAGATFPSTQALLYLARTRSESTAVAARARIRLEVAAQRLVRPETPPSPLVAAELTELSHVMGTDPEAARRMRGPLAKARSDDLAEHARIAWAVAEDANAGPALDFLQQKRAEAKDPYELALGANALVAAKYDAAPWLEALETLVIADGTHWASAKDPPGIETTALAAHVLASREADLARRARAWVVTHRDRSGLWPTATATSAAVRAILDEPPPPAGTDVSIAVDGRIVETFRLEKPERDAPRRVDLRGHATPGEHRIEVRGAGLWAQVVAESSARQALR